MFSVVTRNTPKVIVAWIGKDSFSAVSGSFTLTHNEASKLPEIRRGRGGERREHPHTIWGGPGALKVKKKKRKKKKKKKRRKKKKKEKKKKRKKERGRERKRDRKKDRQTERKKAFNTTAFYCFSTLDISA